MAPINPATRQALRTLGATLLLAVFIGLGLADTQQFVKVKRVIDGDTIMLESGERVRLIGVDTPESVRPKAPVEHLSSNFLSQRAISQRFKFILYGEPTVRYNHPGVV